MPKKPEQSENWDFTVESVPVPYGGKDTGYRFNVRKDTNEVIGVTTDSYGIIQNSDLMNMATDVLTKRGLTDYKTKIITTGGGSKFFAELSFINRTLANSVGDVFGFAFTFKNSFDCSIRGALALGFKRLVCLNGMAAMDNEFSITAKHSSKVTVDFIEKAIDKALLHKDKALVVYDEMARIAITNEQGQTILANLGFSEKLRESFETKWLGPTRPEDEARNLYNLYNAITEHLTHEVAGENYEYAGKLTNNVLLKLVNAARKPANLTKLIIPAPKQVNTQIVTPLADIIDVEATQTPV